MNWPGQTQTRTCSREAGTRSWQDNLPGLWEAGEHAGSGRGGGFVFRLSCMSLSDFACLWDWES